LSPLPYGPTINTRNSKTAKGIKKFLVFIMSPPFQPVIASLPAVCDACSGYELIRRSDRFNKRAVLRIVQKTFVKHSGAYMPVLAQMYNNQRRNVEILDSSSGFKYIQPRFFGIAFAYAEICVHIVVVRIIYACTQTHVNHFVHLMPEAG
jgi:hypothetical protein